MVEGLCTTRVPFQGLFKRTHRMRSLVESVLLSCAAPPGDPGILSHPAQLNPVAVSTLPSPASSSTTAAATEFTVGDNEDEDGMKHLQQVRGREGGCQGGAWASVSWKVCHCDTRKSRKKPLEGWAGAWGGGTVTTRFGFMLKRC